MNQSKYLRLRRVQNPPACLHEMTKAFEVLGLVQDRLLPPPDQQLLAALVEDGIVDDLELAQLADELDVAEHLPLGHVLVLVLGIRPAGAGLAVVSREKLLILLADLSAVLKLISE